MTRFEHSAPSQSATGPTLGHYSDTEWDITTGVGFTALAVAAARAMESQRSDRLVTDLPAKEFVAAAGGRLPTQWPPDTAELAATGEIDAGELRDLWTGMASYLGVRSKFFDEYLHTACAEAGIRQVVLLAAGLDTRAHRLDWPADTHVFEIDHANVLDFKDHVLTQHSPPKSLRHAVGVDLREDWPAALHQAGFDPTAPTAWLAEGLLPFLPDEAKQLLSQRVQALSAAGSQWAIESIAHPTTGMGSLAGTTMLQRMSAMFGADPEGLWPPHQEWDTQSWLVEQGWSITAASAHTLAHRYQRELDGRLPFAGAQHPSVLFSATYEHPHTT